MTFRNLLQQFGAWTTLLKWYEPWMYRVRLKGDWFARCAVAFAVGSLATTVLLVLFAVNNKPPHPLFAFTGMAIFGGLTLLFLVNGRGTARGRVRLCEEGIIRRRMYAGLSAQWAEEWSWPYAEIPQCALVPGVAIGKSFSILMLTDGSNIELIGIPERVNLEEVAQVLAARRVVVRRDIRVLPPEHVRPMSLPLPLVAGVVSLLFLCGGLGFYAVKTAGRSRPDVAEKNKNHPAAPVHHRGQPPAGEVAPAQKKQAAEGLASAPVDIPLPPNPTSRFPTLPLPSPMKPSIPSSPSPVAKDPQTPNPTTPPVTSGQRATATATSKPPTLPGSALANAARTDLLGGPGGAVFEVISPKQVPIVGFRYRLGNWGGKSAVANLDPLSERNAPARSDQLVIARDGYVVGGLQVDAEDLVQAVRVVFVKRGDDGELDKTDHYFSDWIGQPTGRAVKTIGKGNVPVIGVYGRRGLVIDAIGLVLEE